MMKIRNLILPILLCVPMLHSQDESEVVVQPPTDIEILLDLVKDGKISSEKLESINQRTRDGGAEIVKYLEKGSAFYAPAASGVQMAEAYLQDKKLTLPCAVKLDGQYGFKDIYAGVPVIIGSKGVEKIVEIELNDQEKKEFIHSVDSVKKLWDAATKIDPDLK